jgi:hypothetical protein
VRLAVGLVALVSLSACGSRSALLEAGGGASGTSGSPGGGGAPSGGGTTAGGGVGNFGGGGTGAIGGTGGTGAVGACDGLFQFGSSILIDQPMPAMDGSPQIAVSSDDGGQLTVALARTPTSGFQRIVHASFRPFESWPAATLGPTFETYVSPQLSTTFALGSGHADHASLLVSHLYSGGELLSFSPVVEPNAASAGPNVTLSSSGTPLFVVKGPAAHHLVADSNGKVLTGHVVVSGAGSFGVTDVILACGLGVSVADAVPYEGGWLVALANEKTAPPVGCSAAANGATRLDVLRVGADGSLDYVTGIEEATPIVRIAMAPHPQGTWIVWRVASGGIVAPIRWARVNVPAASIVGPGDLSNAGDFPLDDFDATALGSRLLVAWGNDPANNPPDLTLSLLGEDGSFAASTFIEPGFFGPLAVQSSPNGLSLVVGWTAGGAAKLARFDCFGAL